MPVAKSPARHKPSATKAAQKPARKVAIKPPAAQKTKTAKNKPAATKPAKKPETTKAKPQTAKAKAKPAATKPRKRKAKKYTPNDGEKYMSSRQRRYFREVLKEMLTSIRVNSEKTIDSLKDDVAAIPDDNDRASKEAEFTLELRERERERRLKQKIDHAIRLLDKGEFGLCEECGEHIGIARLVARPVAIYCFECKQLQERREKTGV